MIGVWGTEKRSDGDRIINEAALVLVAVSSATTELTMMTRGETESTVLCG